MKLTIKNHMTLTVLAKVDFNSDCVPLDGDVLFFKDSKGACFSAVCKGRIFDYRGGTKVYILVNTPKPA